MSTGSTPKVDHYCCFCIYYIKINVVSIKRVVNITHVGHLLHSNTHKTKPQTNSVKYTKHKQTCYITSNTDKQHKTLVLLHQTQTNCTLHLLYYITYKQTVHNTCCITSNTNKLHITLVILHQTQTNCT